MEHQPQRPLLVGLRRAHPALRTMTFYSGLPARDGGAADLAWYTPEGTEFDHGRWHDAALRTFQMSRTTKDGDAVLLVVNGALNPIDVHLAAGDRAWELVWDSVWDNPDDARDSAIHGGLHPAPAEVVTLEPLSLRVYVPRV